MKKYFIIFINLIIAFSFSFLLACGETPDSPPTDNGDGTLGDGETLVEITGIDFNGRTVTYDGSEHEILITGTLPDGVSVSYQNNKGTNAGNYDAVATLTGEGYEDKTLNAVLVIEKAEFSGIQFNGESFEYDGTEKCIEISGSLPTGSSVAYSCKENNEIENRVKESGTYTIVATITNANYKTVTLEAVMKIQGVEDERHVFKFEDTLYFANALDNDYLYAYDGNEVERVSMDVPYNFTIRDGQLFFRSKALFGNAIKYLSINTSGTETTYGVSVGASCKGEYLVSDGNYFYYAVNGLTQASSGIYKLDISNNEPVSEKIYEGKAKYLQYYDGAIYFADGQNDYKLTKITLLNKSKSVIRDVKIKALTCANGYLFYTVNNLLGDYVENYRISNGTYRKLTIDAGANLTLVGNNLYYLNVDLLTSAVNGDGIYYVNAYPGLDMNATGTKLVGNDTYSSLTKISDNEIAYYRVSDQMLVTHNITTGVTVEVLEDFEIPEGTILSTGSKTGSYDGVLYYLDLYKDKCLYSYDPTNESFRKITANKVTDFSIIGDYLYYNSVSVLVNNDLYRVNLKLGGEPELISTFDCVEVVFDGDKIFYVEQNALGVRTAIRQVNANGEDIIVYSKGVNNLRVYKNYLYFEDGEKIYKMPTSDYTVDEKILVFDDKNVGVFEIYNDIIYFREVGLINKYLSKVSVDGTGYQRIIDKIDPVDIIVEDGYIYYYSDTVADANAGIYKVAVGSASATKIIGRSVSGVSYYPTELCKIGNAIYFINYALSGILSDSHLYKVDLTKCEITKLT